ncbi:hypothetical protein [Nocardia cyriacigeorgica]|uniref:hypothetical protein n=1 Tax=Nocardia cyriacigeorgica TaxID=135487 RepID=UPI00245877CF|nr:hypothetical protein [Nocardia cyriacigeorgica]
MVLSPGWFDPSLSSPSVAAGGWFGGSVGGGLLPASVVRAPSPVLLPESVFPVSPAVGCDCSLVAGLSASWPPPGAAEVGSVVRDWSAGGMSSPAGLLVVRGPSLPVLVGSSVDAGCMRAGGSLLFPESSVLVLAGLVWSGWLPVSVLSGAFSPPRLLLPLVLSPPRPPSLPALWLAGFWSLPRSLPSPPRSPSLPPLALFSPRSELLLFCGSRSLPPDSGSLSGPYPGSLSPLSFPPRSNWFWAAPAAALVKVSADSSNSSPVMAAMAAWEPMSEATSVV